MNKRLEKIYSYINEGLGMIDVGTDHGYLPIELAANGYGGNIIASDINEGPLLVAKRNALNADVQDKMSFLLSDGLEACDSEKIDTIVIAGMGGDTICGILDRSEWCMDRRFKLILQPMTKSEILRYWLIHNEFEIEAEDLVRDGKSIYQILIARFGGKTSLLDAELYTGEFNKIKNNSLSLDYINIQIKRFEKLVKGLEHSDDWDSKAWLSLSRQILSQLEGMNDENCK